MKTRVYLKITLLAGLTFYFVPSSQSQILSPIPKKIDKHKAVAETVDLPEEKIGSQGNWVRKKEWLKDSIKINEEIQKLVEIIQKAKRPYSEKARIIDGELDTFYKEQGFEQGKLQELFAGVNKYLEKKKKKEIERAQAAGEQGVTGELEIKINLIEKEIDKYKGELEQLRLDMQSIGDLDKSVHDRLKKVDDEITITRSQSDKADQLTDETWYIIDDKIARKNYYELKGNILETIKSIQNYLQVDLSNDFDTVLSNIRTQIDKVKEEIKSLEEKEFIIKNRAERVDKLKREEIETIKAKKLAAEKEAKEAEAKRIAQQPWYYRIYSHIVNAIANTYLFIKNIFVGTKEQATPPQETPIKKPTEQPVAPPTTPIAPPEKLATDQPIIPQT